MWESMYKMLCINVYVYELWNKGTTIKRYSLFKIKANKSKYADLIELPALTITEQQINTDYSGNKYIVPINYTIKQ